MLAGFINDAEISDPPTAGDLDIEAAKGAYSGLFESLFYIGLVVGVLLLLASPLIKKMMHGIDDEGADEIVEDDVAILID